MSVPFRAGDAVDWTGGALVQGAADALLRGASIDTRTLAEGELFVAIVGEHHDAHAFLGRAAATAGGLMVERGRELPADRKPDLPVVAVDDTTRALGALAAGHRAGFAGPLVAITGSNGKTTTKEMCAAILSVEAPCLRNEGNLNNQFGLPLTLLRRAESHRSAVVELGMNHRGEIAALAAIARPTVGVVTNVGTAHIEFLGSREEIALEKGDLVAALPPDGCAVLNADDPRVAAQAGRTAARVLRFGRGAAADVRAEEVRVLPGRGHAFALATPDGRVQVEVEGLGETGVANALAAAGGALAAGASLAAVAEGLRRYRPIAGRLQRRDLPGGGVLVDDTYNANPQSLALALETLVGLPAPGRAIAVIGSMGELGADAVRAHLAAGGEAVRLGVDFVLALGPHAAQLVEGARAAGLAPERTAAAGDHEELVARLRELLQPGDRVLVKGSRAMRMERVVRALMDGEA